MNALISNPADCEVRGVIRFLQAENVRPSYISLDRVEWMGINYKGSQGQTERAVVL
jgi:hypothetical protein